MRAVPRSLVVVVVTAFLLVAPRLAHAQKRPVHIESDPPGANVYLGDKESGSKGQTPLDLDLPPGEYTVILELDGHVPAFQQLVVEDVKGKRAKEPTRLSVTLESGVAMLGVTGKAPADARVLIDGKDRGALPVRVELEAGAHQVQVVTPGREPYEQWIELEGGQDHTMTVDLFAVAPPPPAPKAGPKGPPGPLAVVRLGSRFVWRRFGYDDAPDPMTTPAFTSDAVPMFRFDAEVAPWRTSRAAWRAWPVVLVLGAGITTTATRTIGVQSANYNQRELEAGLRYRLRLAERAALGFDVGWAALLYNFAGDAARVLPDVTYHAVRLGVRGEGKAGPAVGWVGIENRLVAGSGDLGDRFATASADGFAARAGVLARFLDGRLEVGAEYALVRFGWTFDPREGSGYVATGGTDTFHNLGLWLGGAY